MTFPNLSGFRWLETWYQIYRAQQRSVAAVAVYSQLVVVGGIHLAPRQHHVSELEEEEGGNMFCWLPVPVFPLPVDAKPVYVTYSLASKNVPR